MLRYAVAVAAFGAALWLSLLLRPLVAPNPFLLFFAAIALSAWFGGLGPGLLVTALSALGVDYFFFEPALSLKLDPFNAVRIAAFSLVAALISGFSEARRRAEQAEAKRAEALTEAAAARLETERAHERAGFLADAGRLLATSLDYRTTLQHVADLVVPHLADWCVIDLLDDSGQIQLVAAAHVDPNKVTWVYELRRQFPVDSAAPMGALYVIRSGEPQLIAEISDELLQAAARTPEELRILQAVGYRSAMVVALRARERVLGALSFVVAESPRRYGPDDLALAQELAERAAVAIDNTLLYRAAQEELAQRQRAERALQVSEAQLRLIADALPVLIAYLDRDQHYRFNNQAYELWFGVPSAEFTGRHIRDVVGPEGYATVRPYLEAALAGETVSFEALVHYRLGGGRQVRATYVPDRGEDGSVRGVVVLAEDVAARVRAEAGQRVLVAASTLLAASLDYEANLTQLARLTVPALADYTVIYLVDGDGRVSRTAAVHRDPGQEQLLTELERQYPLDPDSDLPVARVLRGGEPELGQIISDELLARSARDARQLQLLRELRPCSFLAVPLRARGRTLGAMVCGVSEEARQYTPDDLRLAAEVAYRMALAIDNATLYRGAREARDAAEQAARRTARLQEVTAALGATATLEQAAEVVVREGVAAVDADAGSVFLLADDGATLEALSHRGYGTDIDLRHLRTSVAHPGPLRDALATRALVAVESAEELVGRWPHLAEAQARSGDAATVAVPLLLDARALGVFYVAFRSPRRFSGDDKALLEALARQGAQAFDRARLYAAERAARTEAEAAIQLRDQFLSVAAHELKTPLTSLLLQAQLLQRRFERAELPERERRILQILVEQSRRLDRMIAALLDISRLELGQLSLARAPLDLSALTRRVVAELQPTTEAHTIVCRGPERGLFVDGDELRLEQVLQNLLQNAIKYSPQGGEVEIELGAQDGMVYVAVADRGVGIPAEALPRIFERFYRAPNTDPSQISGMGIGLYVVREIVRLHGGSVRAAQRAGGGSCFSVSLPRALKDEVAHA